MLEEYCEYNQIHAYQKCYEIIVKLKDKFLLIYSLRVDIITSFWRNKNVAKKNSGLVS